MRKNSIKLQFRSIFLQGLLTEKKIIKKISFSQDLNKTLFKYYTWINKHSFDAVEMCLNFVAMNKLKNIIIGVNNFEQYKKIIDFKNKKHKFPTFNIKQTDKNLILRIDKWKKNYL